MATAYTQTAEPRRTPVYFGMVLFVISEVFLFGALFWAFYYLRARSEAWPPAGVELSLTLPVINTIILLASSAAIWAGTRAISRGSRQGLVGGLAVTLVLGLTFLGITSWEWVHEPFRPWSHAYGSIFYTLTGFHALHVFIGALMMSMFLVRTRRGLYSANNYAAIEAGSLYWHFVDVVWLVVFSSIFLVR